MGKRGTNLKKLRDEYGYTQEALAQKTGFSIRSISAWESGRDYPNGENLITLADLFHVSADYILDRTDFKSAEKDFIGNYTGLSDKSVEVLHFLSAGVQDSHQENLQILNFILENQYLLEAPAGQLHLVRFFTPGKTDFYRSAESPLLKNTDNLLHLIRRAISIKIPGEDEETSVWKFEDGEREEMNDLRFQHYLNRITGMITQLRKESNFQKWMDKE